MKFKVNERRFFIPVPYIIINIASLIIASNWFNRFINKAIEKDGSKFIFPVIEREQLKPLLKELSNHRGLTLIETVSKDGTEIKIKL